MLRIATVGALLALAGAALAQTVTVPYSGTVPVPVVVSPGQVSVNGTVFQVPPVVAPPTCGPQPPPTSVTAACPAGQTGSITTTTTYSSSAYPVCWVPTATVVNTCTTPPVACARPGTGTGLYVACGKVLNPDGTEFRIRGVNRDHYDSPAQAGIQKAGFNTVRTFLTNAYGANDQQLLADVAWAVPAKIVNVLTVFAGDTQSTTCKTDTASLQANVTNYVNKYAVWGAYNQTGILNIANEWGPTGGTTWRDQYVSAVKALRAAGYKMPLMIDAPGCGQDKAVLPQYAAAVAAADPEKNVIFSTHIYGGTANASAMQTWMAQLSALSAGNPALAFVVGEFGPGRDIGPSPTMLAPDDVIAAAEARGIGWLGWAMDDGNLSGGKANDQWFSMTYSGPGIYNTPADLTIFGKDVITTQLPKYPPQPAKVF